MITFLLSLSTALWLGVLTSISPCPLATNIAATGFISKKIENPKKSLFVSLSYILGRSVAYIIIAIIVVWGLLSIPSLSMFLQKYLNKILGPLLILVGMFLMGLLNLSFSGSLIGAEKGVKLASKGFFGGFLLGFIFALSFCPVSAALFFGSLIPLAVSNASPFLHPLIYGIGTGLPVVLVATLFIYSANYTFKILNLFKKAEKIGSILTGTLFIAIGIYFSLKYIFLA
ncbi:MAG: aromatic aminobenezylarsenical efflux permease ArsG family transporter [Acidobacteria bacterium]|nr:aromatic aminobenezylarsenical efflux permease ArsG family transporter [Acidobacteriota bacterium]